MHRLQKLTALLCVAAVLLPSLIASADSYLYVRKGQAVPAPAAYILSREVTLEADGLSALTPQDVYRAGDGTLYIADTGNDRILICGADYRVQGTIARLTRPDGSTDGFQSPEGVYVDGSGTVYVADTGNHRIVRCSVDGAVQRIIEKPTNLTGVSEDSAFNPTKLSVDSSGRLYVVARNYNLGILQLDATGGFVGYIGAPRVQYNLVQMLWRKLSTEEQLAKMEQYVPTEYNNLAIDSEGFVYGTIGTLDAEKLKATIQSGDTSGSVSPIKKLNTTGSDVLKRNGFVAPVGDLEYEENPSKIVDVAYGENGVYALLDAEHGHVFLYDDNGNLLCTFGGNGTGAGAFRQVSSLVFAGRTLVITDALTAKLYVYSPTEYGALVLDAVAAQYTGDFDEAYARWSEVAQCNRNFEYAFVGVGQAYSNDGEYEQAMECFAYADDKTNYSKAKALARKETMRTVFPVIFIALLVAAAGAFLFGLENRARRYIRGEIGPGK